MTFRMADSINPAALPAGMDAYAGYDDGNWPDYQAIAAAHPGAHLLDLTVWLANRGVGLDVEPGDASVAQAPVFVNWRHAAGVALPVVYCPASWSQAVLNAMAGAKIPRGSWRLLSAHYGAGQHICGPGTCGYPPADGTQWVDHGTWDESLLADGFFGTPAPVRPVIQPAPALAGPVVNHPEDLMNSQHITVLIGGGKGWTLTPAGATGKIVSVVVDEQDPAVVGSYPPVPAFAGPSSDGHLVFGAGPFGPAPDGEYGFTVNWLA
jgi:hypothetical protein